jgi:hypothetical protein
MGRRKLLSSGKIIREHSPTFMTHKQPSSADAKLDRRRVARQARQRVAKRSQRIQIAVGLMIGIAIIAGVVLGVRAIGQGPDTNAPDRVQIADEGRKHVPETSNPNYTTNPPASGDHYPVWSQYGVFREPVDPGYWVHNLEHGAIVLLYSCVNNCDSVAAQIEQVYDSLPDGAFGEIKFVATPYAGEMESSFILISWTWQEPFDIFDAAQIKKFYGDFVDRGPERAP